MQRGLLRQMQITDVRVRKITKEGKMKAIVSITIDDEFVVHDIKVIEGEKGHCTSHQFRNKGFHPEDYFGELRKSTCRTDRGLILEKTYWGKTAA